MRQIGTETLQLERRRWNRYPVHWSAVVEDMSLSRTRNVSMWGACVDTTGIALNTRVNVTFVGDRGRVGSAVARVCWVDQNNLIAGLNFDRMNQDLLVELLDLMAGEDPVVPTPRARRMVDSHV